MCVNIKLSSLDSYTADSWYIICIIAYRLNESLLEYNIHICTSLLSMHSRVININNYTIYLFLYLYIYIDFFVSYKSVDICFFFHASLLLLSSIFFQFKYFLVINNETKVNEWWNRSVTKWTTYIGQALQNYAFFSMFFFFFYFSM